MQAKLNYILQGLMVACLVMTAPVQAALLDGQTVQTSDFHGTSLDSLVGPGTELTNFAGSVDIDFLDTQIIITATRNAPFSALEFLSFGDANGTILDFVDVTVNPLTDYAGFNASRISFNADIINVNLTDLPALQGQRILLDLTGAAAVPAPEPATVVLLVLGIAFLSLHKFFVQYLHPTWHRAARLTVHREANATRSFCMR